MGKQPPLPVDGLRIGKGDGGQELPPRDGPRELSGIARPRRPAPVEAVDGTVAQGLDAVGERTQAPPIGETVLGKRPGHRCLAVIVPSPLVSDRRNSQLGALSRISA